jgi:type IV pilus assembly protein PilM
VVDWNKEVKLSDLIGRKQKEAEDPAETPIVDEVQLPAETSPPPESPAAPVAVSPAPPVPPATADLTPVPEPWVDPEPEAELETPVDESVPWYKRELSFGKKPKTAKPKAEKPAKQPKQKKQKLPKEERVPFYKRELSFGGKKADRPKATRASKSKSQKAATPAKQLKRVTGLKIGGSQLAAARVHNNGVPELMQVARQDLEPGVIVSGELRDPDALVSALKDFFKRHKLPRQGVRLGIANNRIGVRTFELSGIDDVKQLENAIRFRAHEALPIPIEEAVIDWQILDEWQDEEGGVTRRILLVVAYRDLLDRYVEACKKAGIKLVGIDLEAFALLRAIAEPLPAEAGPTSAAVVVVAVGHDRSTFAVSDGRVCAFTRVLDWGGATLNVAIARELDIAPSEAEPIKRVLSLTQVDTPEGLTDDQARRAREAMQRQLQSFARELVSSLQFYQKQANSLGIGEIVLTGGTAHLHGLAEELQMLIGVGVRPGDPLARVKVGKRVKDAEQVGSLAIAIGLGIED